MENKESQNETERFMFIKSQPTTPGVSISQLIGDLKAKDCSSKPVDFCSLKTVLFHLKISEHSNSLL